MKKIALALLLVLSTSGIAFATDGDIYRDAYTSENSVGTWTFTNYASDGLKRTTHVITTTSDTPSAVTAARTGNLFVLGPSSVTGAGSYVLTLPTAAAGLTYTFSTATSNTLAVRTAGASDVFYWGNAGGSTKLTSPASSGSTVTVVGNTNSWYVTSMSTPAYGGGHHDDWTSGTR